MNDEKHSKDSSEPDDFSDEDNKEQSQRWSWQDGLKTLRDLGSTVYIFVSILRDLGLL